ncbi:MAG: hypothetical protein JWO95_2303, partial [Verrucomicrobiales bacterium]|nr:hypothetical protein [Verrucomicrobiales bacterium]
AHPHLSLSDWQRFRDVRSVSPSLESSYPDWIKKVAKRELETSTRLKPFVSIPIAYDDFAAWIDSPQLTWSFSDLCYYANDLFEERVRTLLFSSSDQAKTKIIPLEYILVELQEIGSDEANDLASIYHVCLTPGFERKDTIFEDENIFLYYALTVASSYAVKRNVDTVLYYKRKGGSPSSSRVSVEL